ncbi:MAG: outer membrane beta-barrel protein [Xanthobacteraceae bacterium]
MKRILLASVAALGLAGTASAADLAVRAPVPVPLFSWTGCYLGINGGWIGGNDDYTTNRTIYYPFSDGPGITAADNARLTRSYSSDQSGGTLGGQFGCQYQAGWLVIGGEWDANWSTLEENNSFVYPAIPFVSDPTRLWFPHTEYTHKQLDWFSTARVRVGAAWWDRVLVYATGGLALGGLDSYTQVAFNPTVNGVAQNPNFFPQYFGGYRNQKIGWTLGGGIEWAFAANWTAKAEFLYLDLGSFDYLSPCTNSNGLTCGAGESWHTSIDAKEYVARVGINYLFHFGPAVAPVVARY